MNGTVPRISELLRDRVLEATGRRIQDLDVEVTDNVVVLRGKTTSFHTKQLAQHCLQELLSSARLINTIEVTRI